MYCTREANIAYSGERVGRGRERDNAAHTHGSARHITKGACTRNRHIAIVHLYYYLDL